MIENLDYTAHSVHRMAQRNLSYEDVQYIIRHGRVIHRAGTRVYFLGQADIPAADRRQKRWSRLVGSVVHTISKEDDWLCIITLYRNRQKGLKDHRKKTKHNNQRRRSR